MTFSPRLAVVNRSGVVINVMPAHPEPKPLPDHLYVPIRDDEYCAPGWCVIDGKFVKVDKFYP